MSRRWSLQKRVRVRSGLASKRLLDASNAIHRMMGLLRSVEAWVVTACRGYDDSEDPVGAAIQSEVKAVIEQIDEKNQELFALWRRLDRLASWLGKDDQS